MHRPSPLPLPMAQIIASDAPLLSPTGESSYQQSLFSPTNDSFSYNYYLPPSPPNSVGSAVADSPIPAERVLKMRVAVKDSSDDQEMCISTHKLFETYEAHQPHNLSSPSLECIAPRPSVEEQSRPVISIKPPVASTAALKRSASPTPSVSRKRSVGERISTKDFIPPDVSGLSKREARLVKNRAAAFLSRQRKREEFESMEIRLAELEQENARLLAITQVTEPFSHPKPQSDNELASEVEMLRAQLANAQQRELQLSQELATKSITRDPPVKIEAVEPTFPLSSPRSQSPHKSAASLGLMVLLCALPTLLSMPTQSSFPTSFSLPTAFPAAASSDFSSIFPPNFDWSQNSIVDLDTDEHGRISSLPQKLEFSNPELSKSLGALGGLDISFDAVPQEDGKIRVRIHPTSSASSRAGSPGLVSNSDGHGALGLDLWGLPDSDNPTSQAAFPSYYGGASSSFTAYSSSSSNGDPFLGVGGPSHNDFGDLSPFSSTSSFGSGDMDYDFGRASDYSPSLTGSDSLSGSKRRVRIALKSMPAIGGEGGEWEVQFC
ncbi:hypothetical protein J3R30DRAFT_1792852 [Lentinula aciculospora]|uniref:BZIP domain-containing protein n=1 Tax=Lentinula aciculospora TaxID=153920 RepID=A0A9W9AKE2_9AGAR|nr:hypothetical protein J3R30DRAFT_1792852 [Lentinula aciculospora]